MTIKATLIADRDEMETFIQAEIEKLTAQLNNYSRQYRVRLEEFTNRFDALVATLTKMGLEIESLSHRATGHGEKVWTDDTRLAVTLHTKPISTKFKFIDFAGYDSRGAGRNEKRLRARAAKFCQAIKDGSGIENVNIYSGAFELRNDVTTKSLNFSVWF